MFKVNQQKIKSLKKSLKISKRLIQFVWHQDKPLVIIYLLSSLLPALIPIIDAFIYAHIIDFIVRHIAGSHQSYSFLYLLIGFRLLTLLVLEFSSLTMSNIGKKLWTKLPLYLYQDILASIATLDIGLIENSEFANKLERVRDSYSWRPINMFSDIVYSFSGGVQVIIAAIYLITLNPLFILLILLSAIPTFMYQNKTAKIVWSVWESNSSIRKRFWYLSELIHKGSSAKELKIFQLSNMFLSQFRKNYNKFIDENEKSINKATTNGFFISFTMVFPYIIIEFYVILKTLAKKISLGNLTYYTTILLTYQNGLNGLFSTISSVYDNSQYVNELFEIIDTKPTILSPSNPIKLNNKQRPRIEFKDVSFTYPGNNKKVLDNFSLVIENGQKIAFVGENGSGKTTIIKLLARFYDVDSGEILINGINIKQIDLVGWYDELGILFQDFLKYDYSLRDNIYFGDIKSKNDLDTIVMASKKSGVDLIAKKLNDGYEQMLGKTFNGVDLSIGQWQKVALARGFFKNSSVLILDEPTASIDAKAESQIFEKVERLTTNKTVLIISHRFSTVRNADKIYVLKKGSIVEAGSHQQLMELKGDYANLFNLQASGYK